MTNEYQLAIADAEYVRRGYTDPQVGPAIRLSVQFQMAEQRLAAAGYFWKADNTGLMHVADSAREAAL